MLQAHFPGRISLDITRWPWPELVANLAAAIVVWRAAAEQCPAWALRLASMLG